MQLPVLQTDVFGDLTAQRSKVTEMKICPHPVYWPEYRPLQSLLLAPAPTDLARLHVDMYLGIRLTQLPETEESLQGILVSTCVLIRSITMLG